MNVIDKTKALARLGEPEPIFLELDCGGIKQNSKAIRVDLLDSASAVSRVLKPTGAMTVIMPLFSNPFYHSDPKHRTPFGLSMMAYFCRQKLFLRGVPKIQIQHSSCYS